MMTDRLAYLTARVTDALRAAGESHMASSLVALRVQRVPTASHGRAHPLIDRHRGDRASGTTIGGSCRVIWRLPPCCRPPAAAHVQSVAAALWTKDAGWMVPHFVRLAPHRLQRSAVAPTWRSRARARSESCL